MFLLKGGDINASISESANMFPKFLFSAERERAQPFMRDSKISAVSIVDDAMCVEDIVFLFDDVDIDSGVIRHLGFGDLPLIFESSDQMAGDVRALLVKKQCVISSLMKR